MCVLVLLVLLAGLGTTASAQDEDPADTARFRFGALRFTPSISLTNVGVDTNVFNEVENPKRDTTAALGPSVNLWMKLGRSRVSGKVTGQYLYFAQYDSQRAWNTSDEARWEVPLGRITPFATGNYANARQRQGYEIDTYARQRTTAVGLGADVDLGGKTKLTLLGTHGAFSFDQAEAFLGVALAPALNRTSDAEQLVVRYKLTPLTTFVVSGQGIQDRFALEPLRNSNSIKILPGLEFKPFALISGTVSVGYRWFSALDKTMPDYQGVVASVDAKYAVGATQLNLKVSRDLAYSFEPTEPYYALTDTTLIITRRVTSAWDAIGRAGLQSLDYSALTSTPGSAGARIDRGRQFGGGVGYRVGRSVRVGFDTTYVRRRSAASANRDYEGFRSGVSISYGTQP